MNISALARSLDISPSQLFGWRRCRWASGSKVERRRSLEPSAGKARARGDRDRRVAGARERGHCGGRPSPSSSRGARGMIPPGARILLRAAAVDFRKGPEGLVSLVRDAGADPFDGSVYVFRAKRADRIKIVWWDGSGLCLFAKRLERSHFCWPTAGSHEIRLSYAQAMALVEGLDWKRVRAVDVRAPQSAG